MTGCVNAPLSEYLTPYCFGDATQEQLDAFSAHLLECDYCWQEVQRLEAAIRLLRSDSEPSMSFAVGDVVEVLGVSSRLKSAFGGHLLYVLLATCLYALLHPLALLAEIAYDFEHLGQPALIAAPLMFAWMGGTSIAAFVLIWRHVAERGRSGLFGASAVFIAAAIMLGVIIWPLLPPRPVVQANFQTYTAQAGFFKSILLSSPLAVALLLVPFSAVLTLQRQLQQGRHAMVLALITGEKRAVAPRGSLYIKPTAVAAVVVLVVVLSVGGTIRLFEGLTPTSRMNLFMILALARSMCYIGLWIGCCWWYSWAVNEIKRECIAVESVHSSRISIGKIDG